MTVTIDPTSGLGQTELLRRLESLAQKATTDFLGTKSAKVTLINQSENTTYRVDQPAQAPIILRVHRTGYHSVQAIESELAWSHALREDTGVLTPKVIAGDDGTRIHRVFTDEVTDGRDCVFFEFLDGQEPDENNLVESFPNLGEVTARMHQHVKRWKLPNNFERFTWNIDTAFGENPHWGHWFDAPNMTAEASALIERLLRRLTQRLNDFGFSTDRFGLAHCDMRLANLLIHEGNTRVIDFDDCGFSWFLYDMATALSFAEDRTDVPELIDAWVDGYSHIAPLSVEEINEIPSFIMFRRLLILAWIGSHSETELAQSLADTFTPVTCTLADKYLTTHG